MTTTPAPVRYLGPGWTIVQPADRAGLILRHTRTGLTLCDQCSEDAEVRRSDTDEDDLVVCNSGDPDTPTSWWPCALAEATPGDECVACGYAGYSTVCTLEGSWLTTAAATVVIEPGQPEGPPIALTADILRASAAAPERPLRPKAMGGVVLVDADGHLVTPGQEHAKRTPQPVRRVWVQAGYGEMGAVR